MNVKSAIVLLLMITGTVSCFAQKVNGNAVIEKDPRIDQLVEKHRQFNQANPGVEGFRVQIFFDSGNNSKKAAQTAREKFMENYATVPAYLTFKAPYYRVRVGNFRTKLEAEGFLLQLAAAYPNAFTVPDRVQIGQKQD